jgi:spore germination protein YaaH
MTTEEKTAYDLGYFEGQEIMNLALANLQNQVRELRKDKERLDWLLDEESGVNLEYVYTDKRGKYVIVWFDDREDIDKAMQEHFATER